MRIDPWELIQPKSELPLVVAVVAPDLYLVLLHRRFHTVLAETEVVFAPGDAPLSRLRDIEFNRDVVVGLDG